MLWIDIHDPLTGQRLGQTITAVTTAKVTRALDSAGSFSATVIATDDRVLEWLTLERSIQIYTMNAQGEKRSLGSGVITKIEIDDSDNINMTISGPSALHELTKITTKRRRKYADTPSLDIANDLLNLGGWSSMGSLADNQTARFDGANLLSALVKLAERGNFHFREYPPYKIVELGAFGDDSGLKLIKPATFSYALDTGNTIGIISKIKASQNSEGVVNRIYPLGSGEDANAVTLELATFNTPYTVGAEPNGDGTGYDYYIEDTDSIALYGLKEQYFVYKDIVPLSNSMTARIQCANALYTAAVSDLLYMRFVVATYQVSLVMPGIVVNPGDKVMLRYKGVVKTIYGNARTYINVNDYFWVLKATENYTEKGTTLDLTLSNVDRPLDSPAMKQVKVMEDIRVRNIQPGLQTFRESYSGDRDMQQWDGQPTYTLYGTFLIPIDDTVVDLQYVFLRFWSLPLRSKNISFGGSPEQNTYILAASGNYPQDISLYINGVNVTTALNGGVWNPAPANAAVNNVLLDITDYIKNAVGGMQQTHTIEFRISMQTRDIRVPGYGGAASTGVYGNQGTIRASIVVKGTSQPNT